MSSIYSNDYWGGKREGAGRPKIGSSRTIRITLPDKYWDRIDEEIERGTVNKQSEFFRLLCELQFDDLRRGFLDEQLKRCNDN